MTTPVIAPVVSVLDDLDALVPPAFWHCPDYVETIGPEVAELNELFGYTPNPEQRLLLDGSFGMDRTGRLTAFEVFVLAARQNLKTGFMIQRALGKALLLRRPLQIWTAHKESATDTAFGTYARMAEESAEFSKRIKRMPEGKGSKALEFVNGCTIVFRPRTGKAGQSMSADDIDLDEYFAAEPKHEGSLVPTLSTRPNAQIGKVSSAPHAGSHMQRSVMARGRAASQGLAHEPRLLYAEWSPMRRAGDNLAGRPRYAPLPCLRADCTHELGSEGCIADDREVIKLTNPSVGRSKAPAITWDYIESERRSLANPDAPADAVAEWLKERLSIGIEDSDVGSMTLFGPAELWTAGYTEQRPEAPGALALAVSLDLQWAGIVGASKVEIEDPNDPEAEPVERTFIAKVERIPLELATLGPLLQRIQEEHDVTIVVDEKGPAGDLREELEDRYDVAIETIGLDEYAKASALFTRKVQENRLLHPQDSELDGQLKGATWRDVGDGRKVPGRRASDDNIELIEAAVIADYAAEQLGAFNIY